MPRALARAAALMTLTRSSVCCSRMPPSAAATSGAASYSASSPATSRVRPGDSRGELGVELAQRARQRQVGRQRIGRLGRQHRRVDGVASGAPGQHLAHLLGRLDRDARLGLRGRGTQVRGEDDVGRAAQRVVLGRRLGRVDVDRGAGDGAGLQRCRQRGLVDDAAAGHVDDERVRLHRWPAPRSR